MYHDPFTMKSKVLISGAYGLGNSGDKAILISLVDKIKGQDPSADITVITRKPYETADLLKVKAIDTYSFFDIAEEMKRSTLFISGGGSLIQDATSSRSLYYYLWTLSKAKRNGCRVLMYACGIGPVHKAVNRKICKRIINKYVDEIAVRDPDSERTLHDMGITVPITLTGDLALELKAAEPAAITHAMREKNIDPQKKYCCVVLRGWNGIDRKVAAIRENVDYCYEKYGLTPLFLLMKSSDRMVADKIIDGLKAPYEVLEQDYSADILIGIISRMSLMISMRLHSVIFAASQNVPFVALSYDPKVVAFSDYLECDNCIDLRKISRENLQEAIDDALSFESLVKIKGGMNTIKNNEAKNTEILHKHLHTIY